MSHALVGALRDTPDDEALRTVYADHLIERGDPRGELIASWIARDALAAIDPRRYDLVLKISALDDAASARLRETHGDLGITSHKGVVVGATVRADQLALLPALLRDHPVGSLALAGVFDRAAATALADALAPIGVAELLLPHLAHGRIDAAGLATLCESTSMRTLRRMRLAGMGDEAIAIIAMLDGLTSLEVDECEITDAGARRLARRDWCEQRWLGNALTWHGVAGLLESPIAKLAIRQDHALARGGARFQAVLDAPGLRRVEELALAQLSRDDVAAFSSTPAVAALRRLSLGTRLDEPVRRALVASPYLSPELVLVATGPEVNLSPRYSTDDVVILGWEGQPSGELASRFRVCVDGRVYPRVNSPDTAAAT